jgi:phage tail sheath protein FI
MGLVVADLFNLTVRDSVTGATERFVNLTVKESPRRADRVLRNESALVRVASTVVLPAATVPVAHKDPVPPKTIWDDDTASTGVAAADRAVDSAALDLAAYTGDANLKTGMNALRKADLFNLLCIPPDTRGGETLAAVWQAALAFCVARRAMLIVDPPLSFTGPNAIIATNAKALTDLGLSGDAARNAALFFPRVIEADRTARASQTRSLLRQRAASWRTDVQRGVWKAPLVSTLRSVAQGLSVSLTNDENGLLNRSASTACARFDHRQRRMGRARCAPLMADEYKYIRCAASRCSSKERTAARWWCSSRTTSRFGRRSA